ncbi:hypothetical protein A6C57_08550 [Fibrella sp. ES10-3-2-2]|nr:hypothetical protein A6C57_08550 [Fibrella sp. ES10-3-2-2]
MSILYNYFNPLLIAFLGIAPILFAKKIERPRYKWWLGTVTLFACVVSGIKTYNDDKEKESAQVKSDSLYISLKSMSNFAKTNELRQQKFEAILLKDFGIKRDSVSNLPKVANTYNTTIDHVGNLSIGDNHYSK